MTRRIDVTMTRRIDVTMTRRIDVTMTRRIDVTMTRRIDVTMTKRKRTKGPTMIYKTLQKTKDRATRIPLKTRDEFMCVKHAVIRVMNVRLSKSGADPGFCVRGDESRRGVWGPLKVAPRKLLGFEYLGSFSVNNFEAFCECDEVY